MAKEQKGEILVISRKVCCNNQCPLYVQDSLRFYVGNDWKKLGARATIVKVNSLGDGVISVRELSEYDDPTRCKVQKEGGYCFRGTWDKAEPALRDRVLRLLNERRYKR